MSTVCIVSLRLEANITWTRTSPMVCSRIARTIDCNKVFLCLLNINMSIERHTYWQRYSAIHSALLYENRVKMKQGSKNSHSFFTPAEGDLKRYIRWNNKTYRFSRRIVKTNILKLNAAIEFFQLQSCNLSKFKHSFYVEVNMK